MKPYIFIISGKAKVGKDTTANFIKEYCKDNNLKTINLQFSSYIKMYAKEILSWDGLENDKPREFLQNLGDIIRTNINKYFFINRIIEDILVYQNYYDIITISDARLKEELELIKDKFENSYKINIKRPNFYPYKSKEEENHPTEHALDNYNNFDYIINNDGSFKDLEHNIHELLNNIINIER